MMSKKQIVIFVSFVIVVAIGLFNVHGQEKKIEVGEQRITIKLDKKPLHCALMHLMYKYDVAIGFEESTLDKDHDDYFFMTNVPPPEEKYKYSGDAPTDLCSDVKNHFSIKDHLITVDLKDAKLEDVLNTIVKQMQNYDWEINNDVVNIFPIKGRDPRFEKLLSVRVRGFGVAKGEEVGRIQPILVLFLPELKAFLTENNLHAESDRTDVWFLDRPLPVELEFSDMTFKELLNAITKSKRGGWILKTDKRRKPENKGKEFIDILI